MSTTSPWLRIASILAVIVMCLGGCSSQDSLDPEPTSDAATVESVADGQPARVTLREDAVERLGVETAPVQASPGTNGRKGALTIPYAAVVYDAEGAAWAYSMTAPRTYLRVPLTITTINDQTAVLSAGPKAGTQVVVVGAAELVGAEAGISGEE